VVFVLVGESGGILIPDLARYRLSPGRLRGLRLIHTHLSPSPPGPEDISDLTLLRLDMVVVVEVSPEGMPGRVHLATLAPETAEGWRSTSYPGVFALPGDPAALIAAVEGEMGRRIGGRQVAGGARAMLVGWTGGSAALAEEAMEELAELAATAGIAVAGSFLQSRRAPDPRTLVGQGKLREIAIAALNEGADLLVFNAELSPSQLRAVGEATELRVIDRTMLILDIFAQHAKSRGGKIQVELAQLRYLLPRLMGKGTALSRLAGGIGTRGPGETKLEVDRRRIRKRISTLEDQLAHLARGRDTQRGRRGAVPMPVVAIVGYTNVGKSTLLNTLTRSGELAADKLFATLDPVTRRLRLPGGTVCLVTDTVGFIRDLPPELARAFAATFEEIRFADLILHLGDISHPTEDERIETVARILEEMKLGQIPSLLVLNKADLADPGTVPHLAKRLGGMPVSAKDRSTLSSLLTAIEERLPPSRQPAPEG
jgi:GTPase